MEFVKKLFKYLVIIALVLGLTCGLIAGILFIFPNASLFGLRYSAKHKEEIAGEINATLTKVNIETNNFDVVIKPSADADTSGDNNNLRVVIANNFTGYSNNGLTDTQIKKSDSDEFVNSAEIINYFPSFYNGSELNLILKEPTGLISYGSSKVVVYVPANAEGVEYSIKTNTGKIYFDKNSNNSSKTLSTKNINLEVKSSKGTFALDNVDMMAGSNLTISNYIGRVEIKSINIQNVNINSNSGNFEFDKISGNLTVEGNNPYIRANEVSGNVFYQNVVTGYVDIKQIGGELFYKSENGVLKVGKVLGTTTVENKSGETTINQIGEEGSDFSAKITTDSGFVTLGTDSTQIYTLTSVKTGKGKVVIKNLASSVKDEISTNSGRIEIDFVNSASQKNLKATSSSGDIIVRNAYGNLDFETAGKAFIYAELLSVAQNNKFVAEKGGIELKLPAPTNAGEKQYVLNLKNTVNNNLNLEIGNFIKTDFANNKDADNMFVLNQVFPTDKTESEVLNKIEAQTSGVIKIHE